MVSLVSELAWCYFANLGRDFYCGVFINMPEQIRVSIAMTTYNGEKFLRQQLDSILCQTITEFELIICDDNSNDNTWKILLSYANKDKRVKIIKNKNNIGFAKNFEQAINLCSACFIALCDQDDIWYPNHLEVLLDNIGSNVLCVGDAEFIDSKGRKMNKTLSFANGVHKIPPPDKVIWRILLNTNIFQGASMMITKDFRDKVFPIPDGIYHDTYLSLCASVECRLVYVDKIITNYRRHENNVSMGYDRDNGWRIPIKKVWKCITRKEKFVSDRLGLCNHISKIFTESRNINHFKEIISAFNDRKISIKLVKELWDNFEYIKTDYGHKEFVKYMLVWYCRKWI